MVVLEFHEDSASVELPSDRFEVPPGRCTCPLTVIDVFVFRFQPSGTSAIDLICYELFQGFSIQFSTNSAQNRAISSTKCPVAQEFSLFVIGQARSTPAITLK